MRYSRFRLRKSIVFGLTSLSFVFLLILHTLIWSTVELEQAEHYPQHPKPPDALPFWSALNQANIDELQPTSAEKKRPPHSPLITAARIEELYQLVRQARHEQINSYPMNSTWNFEKFLHQNARSNGSEMNIHIDTIDSAGVKEINVKHELNSTITAKALNEHDKIQLRNFIHHKLIKWKENHQNDKMISLADLMYDALAQDEPERLNTLWFEYIKTVTNFHVYNPHSSAFKELLKTLQNGAVSEASEMSQGTQIKIILDLPNGIQGLLKPYRVPRNYQTQPDHFYFSDIERHHAEIAAFHVDKILGFYRVPPLIGRFVNITGDIREKATEELGKTFFISPVNNTCFRGHCSYYCDTSHAICGKPGDHLEGSVQILLPRSPEIAWQKLAHPYRRSYSPIRQVKWEANENYCSEHVLIDEDYHNRLLLDMMDLSAFDFLIGNLDRHHIMRISAFGVNTGLIHIDNGRSFGRYDTDDLSILAPIRQCCFFRYSTFLRLYRISQKGLSKLVEKSLRIHEQLQTILVNEHLQALDRRLEILFRHLETCFQTYTVKGVMIDDGVD